MKAVVLREHGDVGLRVEEVADPVARDGWAVVELRAAALNWHDVLLRQGVYPYPLPRIPGSDGAGVRADTGEEVVVMPSLFWGEAESAPGADWEILGDQTDGTYAEQVVLPEECLFPKPAGWSWHEAAALGLAGLTAHRALFARGGLESGETVLVLGAGGGVATMAISLAAMAGARVLVTTSTEEKLATARELGAEGGVLYTEAGWEDRLGPVDLVVDSVGATLPSALSVLRPGGRVVTFGATGGAQVELDLRGFYFSQCSILGTTMGSPRDFAALLGLLEGHPDWRPQLDSVVPLEKALEAQRRMERREHTGKIVLEVTS